MKQDTAGRWLTVIFVLTLAVGSTAAVQYTRELTHRIYTEQGQPGLSTKYIIEHIKMAEKSGYNGMLLTDVRYDAIEKQNKKFFDDHALVIAEAKKRGISVIPGGFMSYSGVYSDRMLGEASPVRDTPFKVAGGIARCASDHSTGLKNGNFDSFTGNLPTSWKPNLLIPGKSCLQDKVTKHSGVSSLRVFNIPQNAGIAQNVAVKPFRAYRITAWFKTSQVKGYQGIQFEVHGEKGYRHRLLNRRWRPFGTPKVWSHFGPTMPWKKLTADFNSMDNRSVNIRFVFAGIGYGTSAQPNANIWMDDMVVEEVGLYETVIRKNHPVIVKSADQKIVYKEGSDYTTDPRCKKFTDDDFYYEGHLKIPTGSRIKNGDKLRVSWYKFSDTYLLWSETNFCLPETWKAMEDNVERIDKLMGNKDFMFLNYDEWRSAFMDDRCQLFPAAKTGGDYLAAQLDKSLAVCRKANCYRTIYLFNGMYDPYHCAGNPYYMLPVGASNSWRQMDTNIVILNWSPNLAQSYGFFMEMDRLGKEVSNRQIICCQGAAEVPGKVQVIKSLEAKGGKGVVGMHWVTWYHRWQHMALTANAWKAQGWWGTKPLPTKDRVCSRVGVKEAGKEPLSKAPNVSPLRLSHGSGTCLIEYSLQFNSRVDLRMVNAQGRTLKRIVAGEQSAGTHRISVDSKKIPSGVYFFDLQVDGKAASRTKHVIL